MKLSTGKVSSLKKNTTMLHLVTKYPVLLPYGKRCVNIVNPKNYKTMKSVAFPAGYETAEVHVTGSSLVIIFKHVTLDRENDIETAKCMVMLMSNAGKNAKWLTAKKEIICVEGGVGGVDPSKVYYESDDKYYAYNISTGISSGITGTVYKKQRDWT